MTVEFDAFKFGYAIRRWRSDNHVGLRSLARQLSISPTTLSRIEQFGVPDMVTFTAIIDGMGWKAEPFFARHDALLSQEHQS
jgi:transcriptional regulator with XRE-family HTH domain